MVEALIPMFDIVGAAGFLAGTYLGVRNLRLADLERPFWLAFSLTAALGALWLALVALEWLGVSSAVLDQFSTSLQAVVIGLYAVAVAGAYVVVADLQAERRETLQRASIVSILSRVLRHNLRNDLTVIRGLVEEFEGEPTGATAVRETVDDLIETSEKARELEQTLATNRAFTEVDLDRLLNRVIADVGATFPAATVAVEGDIGGTLSAQPSLETALVELVENALEHGGAVHPVRVVVEADDEVVSVAVCDNGPGLPADERELLESDMETQLHHSLGLGLWLAKWVVSTHEGSITAETDGSGTTVTITLPREPSSPSAMPATAGQPQALDRYHAVFEHDVDAVFVLDDDGRILDANRSAGELCASAPADLLGREFDAATPAGMGLGLDVDRLASTAVCTGTATVEGDRLPYVAMADIVLGEHLVIVQDGPDER